MKHCNETITVFNAKYDAALDRDVYIGTIISGVSWFCEVSTTIDSGLKAANKIIIRIPENAYFSGKQFVDPLSYAVSNTDRVFTLHAGDIIVCGVAVENDPKPSDLKKRYVDMATILDVTDNRRAPRGPHWKVVGA